MAGRRFFRTAEKAQQRLPRNSQPKRLVDTSRVTYLVDQTTEHRQPGAIEQALLTVAEASAYLQLPSVKAIYWHIAKNGLPVRRFGRLIRIDQHELEAWTRRQRQIERQTRFTVMRGA